MLAKNNSKPKTKQLDMGAEGPEVLPCATAKLKQVKVKPFNAQGRGALWEGGPIKHLPQLNQDNDVKKGENKPFTTNI